MKVIFLDIDGVLNSYAYDRVRGFNGSFIDSTRLPLLREIIDKTDAVVVLSSSWRRHWSREFLDCDFIGRQMIEQFYLADIEIYDKTPFEGSRADDIRAWLDANDDVESFVILDDLVFGWGEFDDYVVRTDARIGRGLEMIHVDQAVKILNRTE